MSLTSKIESLLFISAKPMEIKQLALILKADKLKVAAACAELMADYKNNERGLALIKNGNKYQMVSAPANATVIKDFIKDETSGELSRPSLEALTIIAYRGPISKIDLDRIRGVNCALILRNLMIRGLIEAEFDKKKHETYYSVSLDFIKFLGINQVSQLPDYERLHKDDTIDRMLEQVKEE